MKMRHFLLQAATLALVAAQPANAAAPAVAPSGNSAPLLDYAAIHHPVVARHGMVVSQEAIASEVGRGILERGGNAVDAAVAVGFALAVTLPKAGNLAGGGFMMIYDAKSGKTITIDYKELAPYAASRTMFLTPDGKVDLAAAREKRSASGVPGTVAAFELALKTYGTMTMGQVAAPAIELARKGIVVTPDYADSIHFAHDKLARNPAAAKAFFKPDGSEYQPGEVIRQPDLAWSIEQIVKGGARAFYTGEIARRMVADQQAQGGYLTMRDMADYKAVIREPLRATYRGYELVLMPPPSSGGVHIIQMLKALEGFDLKGMGHNSAAAMHLTIEAMRQAYADRSKYLGDPDFSKIPIDWLDGEAYARQTRAAISGDKARLSRDVAPGLAPMAESPNTTHYSIWDAQGNVVSNTYSLNYSFGNGVVVPGTGILMNNGMDDFSARPGVPNGYGLVGGERNAIEPHKRSLSSMTPAMIFKDGKPYVVTGSPGGSRIITAVMQVLMNVMDYDMNIADATDAARFHEQWLPDEVYLEPNGFSPDTIAILKRMGYRLEESSMTIGSTQSIMKSGGVLYGAADPRRPGALAAGY
ncbi:gamma-glutamyltransferase [Novosphingobium sp. 1949]|uniref:Glutathione hydrolase proenzyme n=1 Tax=Novosphingobium organovorum TaxID=2930092 RepID=A0ABT0BCT9_9SPHN|nr:gamma-glutamyltransferase [Novosphingobium organovorum]MCJ2182673.1 gamma-glutamyltransferase [Novosphingobium organovorum]